MQVKKKIKIEGKLVEYYPVIEEFEGTDLHGFIYVTKNKIDGKFYVGKSKFNKQCGASDYTHWKNYYGSSNQLKIDIEKHGKENFVRLIIDVAINEKQLSLIESQYIKLFNAIENPIWYNIASNNAVNKQKSKGDKGTKLLLSFSGVKNFDVKLVEELEEYAEDSAMSKTQIIKLALREYLDNNKIESF